MMVCIVYSYVCFVNCKVVCIEDIVGCLFVLFMLVNWLLLVEDLELLDKVLLEVGYGLQMLVVFGGQWGSDDFGEVSYWFIYYDFLDNCCGFLDGVQIQGLGIILCSIEFGVVWFEELDLVSICLLLLCGCFFKLLSWYVEGGLEWVWVGWCWLICYVQGGVGGSW